MSRVGEKDVRGILSHFQSLPDPRSRVNRRHLLIDVIVISICGVLAGADGPTAIETWAKTQRRWLKKYLKLPSGIPAHDTIGRVLEALSPQAFQHCFTAWLESLGDPDPQEAAHLAIDGKALRRSHDRGRGLGPMHLVSVWATQRGVSLGQVAADDKSNEITAIPQLLDQLDLAGAVVTIDAAGCQKAIAEKIVAGGGDYVLAVKGNQQRLHRGVRDWIDEQMEDDFAEVPVSRWEEHETGHGRQEHRYYYQLSAPEDLPGRSGWPGLKTIGMAIRMSERDGKETGDVRYYISSLRRHGRRFARLVRGHWGIENTLHWSLDMTFGEDASRVRARRLAENLAWLRRLALTLVKQHPGKESLVMKRRMAGWSVAFLMQVLTGTTA
jgi:predicted transposase YbfD/YdcC